MASPFKLIAGLGNPTAEYEKTRHNAGFWVLDEIAERNRLSFIKDERFHGQVAKFDFENETLFLLKPMTFMNRSGQAVASLARYYKILPEQIVVAHDDLYFAPGVLRLKKGGGHGGHNGLRDIMNQLGSDQFLRLRIGIGRPQNAGRMVSYVLERPDREDERRLRLSIARAVDAFPDLLHGNIEAVMNCLHRVSQ